jgi:folate-dependent phosphoribosylglycinamide formyltransferase PurN
MRIGLISGDSYRHKYYCNTILDNYDVSLLVNTKRSLNIADEVKISYLNENDKKLLEDHTNLRIIKEKEYFLPKGESFNCKNLEVRLEVDQKSLNSNQVIEAAKKANLDMVLVFGTSLIKKDLLKVLPKYTINLSGLSPYYKGAATLLWPFYFMEPQYAGHTFHIVDLRIDHGDIIHQGRPEIFVDDTLPDIGARDVIRATEELPLLLKKIESGDIKLYPQNSKGKIFYQNDFKPYHLRVIRFLLDNGFLGEYLQNKHLFPDPEVINQV